MRQLEVALRHDMDEWAVKQMKRVENHLMSIMKRVVLPELEDVAKMREEIKDLRFELQEALDELSA